MSLSRLRIIVRRRILVKFFLTEDAAFSESQTKSLAGMTTLAIPEIVAAEGTHVVVAGHAALRPPGAEVLRRTCRRDLLGLGSAAAQGMAIGAIHALARTMVRVAESHPIGARIGAGRCVARQVMANSARSDVAAV